MYKYVVSFRLELTNKIALLNGHYPKQLFLIRRCGEVRVVRNEPHSLLRQLKNANMTTYIREDFPLSFQGEQIKGAAVFLLAFGIIFVVTLIVPSLPPGGWIYDAAIGVDTDYLVLGIEAPTLAAAFFNAVIWGVIVWLIYDLFIAKKVKEVPVDKDKN
jgi:hypothetical protein